MKRVLVTGGNGQLARCIKDIVSNIPEYEFVFKDSSELDVANKLQVATIFVRENFHFCLNCAAYTAVDMAESEPEKAKSVNTDGAAYLAEACATHKVKLIHISTDFVFDGQAATPYLEEDATNPLGVYGRTKLEGELAIRQMLKEHFIIRTSWLYSEYGHNFVKTIIRVAKGQKELTVVSDQKGAPTYAGDLANVILKMVKSNDNRYGTYHYSNGGETSWFGFAKQIYKLGAFKSSLLPVATNEFPTAAKRPSYSVLNTAKIEKAFHLKIPEWQDSLKKCFEKLNAF